jgi:hypothetical protein
MSDEASAEHVEMRTILMILWDRALENVMTVRMPVTEKVGKGAELMATLLNSSFEEEPAKSAKKTAAKGKGKRAAKTEPESDGDKVETDLEQYEYFEWGRLRELPADTPMNQIPKPGIVIAIRKGAKFHEYTSGALASVIRLDLGRDKERAGQRLQRFLASPDRDFEPLPLRMHDVFLSYDHEDESLCKEMVQSFTAKGLRCFQAGVSIGAGGLWKDELRDALRASGALVLLLTPRSVTSQWVMCEVGAAWALGLPIVPATMYVDLKAVPDVVSAHQCRAIETVAGRATLVGDLVRLCRGAAADENLP